MRIEADLLNKVLEAKALAEFYQQVNQVQEHYRRGNDLFEDENYEEALKEYNQALYLSPKNSKVIDARQQTLLEILKKNILIFPIKLCSHLLLRK